MKKILLSLVVLVASLLGLAVSPARAVDLDDLDAAVNAGSADARATAAVRARLHQADVEPYIRMEASVVAGIATLTGTARTQSALDAVVREVGKIAGVRKVEARVKVEPNP
jgi:osmotically-inducible protein OsmY